MKHLKEEKSKKSMSRITKIIICVVIGILVAVGVCTGLWLKNRVTGYREAKNYAEEIMKTKSAVEKYFDEKIGEEGLTDDNKKTYEDFVDAVKKSSDYMESLGATGVLKNETVNEKYEVAKSDLEKLTKAKDIEVKLMEIVADGEFSDDDFAQMSEMGDYLKNMADEIVAYRKKVTDFNAKYENLKGANKKELDSDYAALVAAGDALKKKYAEIKIEDVTGMSRDDILRFYGTIEELNKYLAEKI